MSKRMTDTRLSREKWFRKLNPAFKGAWRFILDECDVAGVWPIDEDALDFYVGEPVDIDKFLEAVNEQRKTRLERLGPDKLIVCDFIEFQYGPKPLSPSSPPHQAVITRLKQLGLWEWHLQRVKEPLGNPSATHTEISVRVKDKDKDKEEDKDKEKEEDKDSVGPISEFDGIAGTDLLSQVRQRAQRAWVDAYGIALIREVLPRACASWETDDTRRRSGGVALYLRHWFENELKAKARDKPPMKDWKEIIRDEAERESERSA